MSPPRVRDYRLYRLEAPLGRTIGDNDCSYESISVVALQLRTDAGDAWGYGDTVSHARFRRPAWYLEPLAPVADLEAAFRQEWWPRLEGREASAGAFDAPPPGDPVAQAVDLALWDLRAKAAGIPVWRLIGGSAEPRPVRAYGSLLDFPLDEAEAAALARRFAAAGFTALKVKVGAPDPERDVERLCAIREAVGGEVELTADANCAWTWREAVARLEAFAAAGIALGYLEDPLRHDDLAGYAELARAATVPIAGHDYAPDGDAAEALLATGGLALLRIGGGGISGMLEFAAAARRHGRAVIAGNSLLEHGAHAALALPGVDRLEFSDLAWNAIAERPLAFADGHVVAPGTPGLGLDPRADALAELAA